MIICLAPELFAQIDVRLSPTIENVAAPLMLMTETLKTFLPFFVRMKAARSEGAMCDMLEACRTSEVRLKCQKLAFHLPDPSGYDVEARLVNRVLRGSCAFRNFERMIALCDGIECAR